MCDIKVGDYVRVTERNSAGDSSRVLLGWVRHIDWEISTGGDAYCGFYDIAVVLADGSNYWGYLCPEHGNNCPDMNNDIVEKVDV